MVITEELSFVAFVKAVERARVTPVRPKADAGEFEIAVRCEDSRVVKGTFSSDAVLRDVRQFATESMLAGPQDEVDTSTNDPSAAQSYSGGTFRLRRYEELQRSREVHRFSTMFALNEVFGGCAS